MSFILNESDIEEAQYKASEDIHRPNLQQAVLTVARLMEWTNANSDGWAYWEKPSNASNNLQTAINRRYFGAWNNRIKDDLTASELKSAYTPIKSFLTRQGVDHSLIFTNG